MNEPAGISVKPASMMDWRVPISFTVLECNHVHLRAPVIIIRIIQSFHCNLNGMHCLSVISFMCENNVSMAAPEVFTQSCSVSNIVSLSVLVLLMIIIMLIGSSISFILSGSHAYVRIELIQIHVLVSCLIMFIAFIIITSRKLDKRRVQTTL